MNPVATGAGADAHGASAYRIAPTLLLRGDGALSAAVPIVADWGDRLLWVEGETGAERLPATVRESLAAVGVELIEATHRGPCSADAVARLRARADEAGADGLVAVGGGRVLDAAKAAADDLGRPFAAIAASPATCAAVTPLSVMYDAGGRYRSTRATRQAPDLAVLDPGLLARAPDRLLVAGILDALAKVHEVRRTTRGAARHAAGARAALALCDDLENLLAEHAAAAVAAGPSSADVRALVAEACVLTPGLIGGVAGEAAKLAAAHPIHNALTALPGSHASLHGELVGFGILVQLELEGRGDAAVRAEAARFARLGVACHLAALGCGEASGAAGRAVALETVTTTAMRSAFPDVTADDLFDAMQRVDAEAGRAWTDVAARS